MTFEKRPSGSFVKYAKLIATYGTNTSKKIVSFTSKS